MKQLKTSSRDLKFIFITGGVLSGVGKGVVAASVGSLLEARKLKIDLLKCDPYLNVDPGTLSPLQHGEVFVTADGFETDLDLGHYERFTSLTLNKKNSITTGQIYQTVLEKERKGMYKGHTVQVIPHVVDEIKSRFKKLARKVDVVIVEIGGTIGDLEAQPFTEAIRQIGVDKTCKSVCIHVSYIPYINVSGELKSKPTQHSVKALRELGIQPDFLVCRTQKSLSKDFKKKIALFCNLQPEFVIEGKDADSIYEVPLELHKEKLDSLIVEKLELKNKKTIDLTAWKRLIQKIKSPKTEINIGLVGKYTTLKESYKSLIEALDHGGLANNTKVNLICIPSESSPEALKKYLSQVSALIVPGGFGARGVEGKLRAIEWARKKKLPVLGICYGMQLMVIEFSKNVCGLKLATSREIKPKSKDCVIDFLPGQAGENQTGGTMRLGAQLCHLKKNSRAYKIYKTPSISERHRHRFEFNNKYLDKLGQKGMVFSGKGKFKNVSVVEIVELEDHPWFLGVQFHPELQSCPLRPHPLFQSLIQSALKFSQQKTKD